MSNSEVKPQDSQTKVDFSKEYKENCWYYDTQSVSNPKLY